jgi:hypothetical protein
MTSSMQAQEHVASVSGIIARDDSINFVHVIEEFVPLARIILCQLLVVGRCRFRNVELMVF